MNVFKIRQRDKIRKQIWINPGVPPFTFHFSPFTFYLSPITRLSIQCLLLLRDPLTLNILIIRHQLIKESVRGNFDDAG